MMRSPSGLILPDDFAELLIVSWDGQASDHDVARAIALNGSACDWLDGKIETDTFTDQIAEVVGDPFDYLDYVEALLPPEIRIFQP